MKGVVLAGGLGSRMYPLTKATNKHLLPIYREPMIYYPIRTLVNAGIDEILIVTGGNSAEDFLRLLGNGKEFGIKNISYAYQEGEGGIAAALSLAEHFANKDQIVVVLGDNIIEKNIINAVAAFRKQKDGARVLLKEVPDPQRFGVATVENGQVITITEKPTKPASNYVVIGIYMYENTVFDFIRTLEPSARGEMEITDVNNYYIKSGKLSHDVLDGWWSDAGTFDSLLSVSNLVAKTGANNIN